MGWEAGSEPTAGSGVYNLLRLDGGKVCGLFELTAEMRAGGVPPNWLPYVAVEDARATAERALTLDGTVEREPFQVGDGATIAVLSDPAGGTFAVWQGGRHAGSDFVDGRPGTPCWHELASRDAAAARAFYSCLFGWEPTVRSLGEMGEYTTFTQRITQVAGMMQMTEEWGAAPSHWMIYFAVDDCDRGAARAAELGGRVRVPPTDIPPVGRFAMIDDPQGAMFSILRLDRAAG